MMFHHSYLSHCLNTVLNMEEKVWNVHPFVCLAVNVTWADHENMDSSVWNYFPPQDVWGKLHNMWFSTIQCALHATLTGFLHYTSVLLWRELVGPHSIMILAVENTETSLTSAGCLRFAFITQSTAKYKLVLLAGQSDFTINGIKPISTPLQGVIMPVFLSLS